jgi:multicomponent Na+:H+ antiporter subunit D
MTTLTLIWLVLPFLIGFTIFLLPKCDRYLALGVAIASGIYASLLLVGQTSLKLQLLDHFGVLLELDPLSGFFILTNAVITAAVLFYCWQSEKTAFFYAQIIMLHGSINAAFICADFISLYVALEVSGIAAFLLIAYPRTDRSIWVALRYLFVSNVAMLLYLVGAVLVYKASHAFGFSGLRDAPQRLWR